MRLLHTQSRLCAEAGSTGAMHIKARKKGQKYHKCTDMFTWVLPAGASALWGPGASAQGCDAAYNVCNICKYMFGPAGASDAL